MKPRWVIKGTERTSGRVLWQVPLVGEPHALLEVIAALGLDASKKASRPLSTPELASIAELLPPAFRPEPDRDAFEITNRFVWTDPWVAIAAECDELRDLWHAIVELARPRDAEELFDRARREDVSVPWLAHAYLHAPPVGRSDPPLWRVLRDGATWIGFARSGPDEVRACLTPPLLEVFASLGEARAEDLALGLRGTPGPTWNLRRVGRINVTKALGHFTSARALSALLEVPGDSGCSRHPEAGARTLEQAQSLAHAHERSAGPPRHWPRLRDLASLPPEERKRILGEPLGGESESDLSRSIAALGKLRYADAEPFLRDVLERCPTYLPRQAAIRALGALDSKAAKSAVFDRFDEALDGLVGRIAISSVLRSEEGLATLPRFIGPDVTPPGLRALNLDNLGEAVSWMLTTEKSTPHPRAAQAVASLVPEEETRRWFDERFAELARRS